MKSSPLAFLSLHDSLTDEGSQRNAARKKNEETTAWVDEGTLAA